MASRKHTNSGIGDAAPSLTIIHYEEKNQSPDECHVVLKRPNAYASVGHGLGEHGAGIVGEGGALRLEGDLAIEN